MSDLRLLIVDHDVTMLRLLRAELSARGYEIRTVDNGIDAITAVADYEPHLILMDACIPGIDGQEVCKRIRAWSTLPIILMSALTAPQIRASALDLGADDYITKPFHMGELAARIRAVLRRATASHNAHQCIVHLDDLTIDIMRREVRRGEQPEHLTKIEFDLLQEFLNNTDRVLTYQHLLNAVWGVGYDDLRLVHVHVCNLRRKLEKRIGGPRHIVALPGVGYRFTINDPCIEPVAG